jgi:hypothetical protein
MWQPRRLTKLWPSTACYRDSFTYSFLGNVWTCPPSCSSFNLELLRLFWQQAPSFTGKRGVIWINDLFLSEQNSTCIRVFKGGGRCCYAQPLLTCSKLKRTIPGQIQLFSPQRSVPFGLIDCKVAQILVILCQVIGHTKRDRAYFLVTRFYELYSKCILFSRDYYRSNWFWHLNEI